MRVALAAALACAVACAGLITSGCTPEPPATETPTSAAPAPETPSAPAPDLAEPAQPDEPDAADTDTVESAQAPEPEVSDAPRVSAGTVVRVVDGDTAHVKLDDGPTEKVRFIGIDTPESTREIEPYGKEASAYTRAALDGRKVFLETDVEKRDRYGRLLAYVWLDKPATTSDKEIRAKLFNARLLLDGYANVYTFPPNVKYVDRFLRYEREARDADRGLWSIAAPQPPPSPGSDAPYLASARSDVFHEAGCTWAAKIAPRNLLEFASRDGAIDSGRRPCKVCRP